HDQFCELFLFQFRLRPAYFRNDFWIESTAFFAATYNFLSPILNIEILRDLVNAVTITLHRNRRKFFAIAVFAAGQHQYLVAVLESRNDVDLRACPAQQCFAVAREPGTFQTESFCYPCAPSERVV